MTATWPVATFVASHDPPMPTSTTATSIGASAKAAYAIATIISKYDSGCCEESSTICAYAATSANASTNWASVSGTPSS